MACRNKFGISFACLGGLLFSEKEVSELMTELMQAATRELLDVEEEDETPLTSLK